MSKYITHIFPENFIKSNRSRDIKKAKCVLIVIVSSNINEVIKTVLSFFIFFRKDFTRTKKHKTLISEQK